MQMPGFNISVVHVGFSVVEVPLGQFFLRIHQTLLRPGCVPEKVGVNKK
jgi:hypothetical protein